MFLLDLLTQSQREIAHRVRELENVCFSLRMDQGTEVFELNLNKYHCNLMYALKRGNCSEPKKQVVL
jgi:hypothetical protein